MANNKDLPMVDWYKEGFKLEPYPEEENEEEDELGVSLPIESLEKHTTFNMVFN